MYFQILAVAGERIEYIAVLLGDARNLIYPLSTDYHIARKHHFVHCAVSSVFSLDKLTLGDEYRAVNIGKFREFAFKLNDRFHSLNARSQMSQNAHFSLFNGYVT
jgi:hypothetical protein